MAFLAIFNPISGAGRARAKADALAEAARRRGVELELRPTEPDPPETWLRPFLAGNAYRAIVVIGGDGAVRLVAPEAALAGIPIVHCPEGNENLFAREFGMTNDPDRIIDLLERGRRREIDLIDVAVAGRPVETAVLMASFGFDAEVVHDLAARRTGSVSNLSYVAPMLRAALRLSLPTVTAVLDGQCIARRIQGLVIVANSRQYAIRLDPARRAEMDDGRLDVAIFPCRSVIGLLGWLGRARMGLHLRSRRLIYGQGRTLELHLEPAHRWQVDGDPPHRPDPVGRADFSVRPGVLSVLELESSRRDSAEIA